jgi:transcriptional regulator with XRE-family HTH domain
MFLTNLKQARKKAKMSQQKLADVLGVRQSAVANRGKGYRESKLKDLPRIAEVMGVKVKELVR